MPDRVVTVRLRLDTSQVPGAANSAAASMERVGRSAETAAASAEAAAHRSSTAVGGTFSAASRASTSTLATIDSAASRSSMALANSAAASTRTTSAAARAAVTSTSTAASAAARATTSAAQVAAQATTATATAAGEVSATFRSAGSTAATALGSVENAAARSSMAVANLSSGVSAASVAAAQGSSDISLANRLAMAEAVRASQGITAAQATTATGYRALAAAAVTSGAEQAAAWRAARTAALGLLAVFAAAVLVTANFDKSMSGVQAVSSANTAQMSQLRTAALEAGKATAFSASQAADAEGELARAGVSVADITGGALTGSLALAAAGQLSLSDAATVSAMAMNTFGLKGADVGHIADVLAAGANKSAADVNGLSLALRQGGLVAKQTGLSFEDTVGLLAAFADNALIGSDAGTSMKTMLQRLTPQSQQAKDMMAQLGLKTYDAQGNFVGLTQLAANMQKAFGKLTPEARNSAMGIIFGSDAIRGATVLYQQGAAGIQSYIDEVNDQGAATRMASTQLNNLSGDLHAFRGSLEVALIDGGGAANTVLREMVKWLTDLVNAYVDLPAPLQITALALFGIVGAITLVGTTFILAVPKVVAFQTAMTDLAVTMPRVAAAASSVGSILAGPWGIALGLGIAALTAFGLANSSSKMAVTDFDSAIQADTGHIGDHTRALAAQSLAQSGAFQAAEKYGISQGTVMNAALGNAAAIKSVNDALVAQHAAFKFGDTAVVGSDGVQTHYTKTAQTLMDAVNGTNKSVNTSIKSYKDQTAAMSQTKGGTAALGGAALTTADDLQQQATAVQKLTDLLNGLNGVNITAAQDQIHFQGSLADLTQAVKDNGHSLDTTTDKGRKVKGAYLDAAAAAMTHAEAVADQTNSVDKGNAALARDVSQLERSMKAAGFTKAQIQQLTAAYTQIPTTATTTVTAPGAAAAADQIEGVRKEILATPGAPVVKVTALTTAAMQNLTSLGFTVKKLPNGLIQVTLPTTGPMTAADRIQARVDQLHGTTITITTVNKQQTVKEQQQDPGMRQARGSITRYYAAGGMEQHVAQFAPAGAMRVWAEPETGGEAYIPLGASKRKRSRSILEQTAELMGGRVAWFANGGVTTFAGGGFSYTPNNPVLGTTSDVLTAYTAALAALTAAMTAQTKAAAALATARTSQHAVQVKEANAVTAAERHLNQVRSGHHTTAQLAAAEAALAKARATAAAADAAAAAKTKGATTAKAAADAKVAAADKAAGVAKGAKVTGFDLGAYEKQLNDSLAATEAWRANLSAIGARGGSQVESILQGMGADGAALTAALAKASAKDFATITSNLEKLSDQAKATLADFDAQVSESARNNAQFAGDLTSLASRGYGGLAQQLAGQGDQAAIDLAHQAAGASDSQLAKISADLTAQQNTLSGTDLQNALIVLTSLRSRPGEGIGDVVAAGISASDLLTLTPKILAQIQALPDAYKQVFLKQYAGQTGPVTAMARGGILPAGSGTVIAAEGSTGDEAWIPLGMANRARSTGLLTAAANRMGYQLLPAGRFTVATAGSSGPQEVHHHRTVNLHQAAPDFATQLADTMRHMNQLA